MTSVPSQLTWRTASSSLAGRQRRPGRRCRDHGWIHDLTSWVRDVHRAGVQPGCLPTSSPSRPRYGAGRLRRRPASTCSGDARTRCSDMSPSFTAFQTHADRVAELPCGCGSPGAKRVRHPGVPARHTLRRPVPPRVRPRDSRVGHRQQGPHRRTAGDRHGTTLMSRSQPPGRRRRCSRTSSDWSPPISGDRVDSTDSDVRIPPSVPSQAGRLRLSIDCVCRRPHRRWLG